ncbi:MAG: 1-acyl-sn-glycerol-3-phosphate acyltransferase [Bradyrhizobium sp.]
MPFVLFSATAGQLADKFDKGRVARLVKLLEIAIMALAGVGWIMHNLPLLVLALVGMGLHSTLFGPVKYAYLPQHLKRSELVGGNGLVESGTFVGILLGEVLGALLIVSKPWGVEVVAGGTLALAVLGWWFSRAIPPSPAPVPELKVNWNPFTETVRNLNYSRHNRTVFLSLLGNSWFWFYGAIILAQFPLYAKNYLHGDHGVFVLLLTVFSFGIGAGSLLCEKLSDHRIEIGLVPFGSIGLSVSGVELFFASLAYTNTLPVDVAGFLAQTGSLRILFACLMIGVSGGLYIVPLFALIQTRCDPRHLSRTIAGMNILNALFMVAAALLAMLLLKNGVTVPQLFLVTALLNALVALYIYWLVPEFLIRFLAWLLIHTIHRVRSVDVAHIPLQGAAMLVCNHVSYVDAIVILAASPRPIRFVMDHRIFKFPLLSWLFRSAGAIPIAPASEDTVVTEKAYAAIEAALAHDELVCIFPEGKLTVTGEINVFRGGIMKILQRSPVPVIPMALCGLWGSLFSHAQGNPFDRVFQRGLRSTLQLVIGAPLRSAEVTPESLREHVQALRGNAR